ncbi:MAG: hypothetical protein Q4D42_03765 [Eubacteriales bacterium]|nr:hypothetical protein [Eubacteriales bacterium]
MTKLIPQDIVVEKCRSSKIKKNLQFEFGTSTEKLPDVENFSPDGKMV